MTHQIRKYTLDTSAPLKLNIPKGAIVLTVHEQNNKICIWLAVPSDGVHEDRVFVVFPTGEYIQTGMGIDYSYLGTAFTGKTVWHVFEAKAVV